MLSRIYTYLKEMYPPLPRFILASVLFFTAYFLLLANNSIYNFNIGMQEFTVVITIYVFLLSLRIADEFKDLDSDYKNFPNRPLPSGRVKKPDLITLLIFLQLPTILLNIVYMNNLIYFVILYTFGILMSFWFFAKKYIKQNLNLALITHNPVQILLNLYIVSFICIKYGLSLGSNDVIMVIVALYLPGLIWEVSRKIRSPKDETKYTTYSKIWGYKRATIFVCFVILACTIMNILLVMNLSLLAVGFLLSSALITVYYCFVFIKQPNKFKLLQKTTNYIYSQNLLLLFTSLIYVLWDHI